MNVRFSITVKDISWVQKRQESSDLCLQDGIGRVSRSLKTMENRDWESVCFFLKKDNQLAEVGVYELGMTGNAHFCIIDG